MAILAAAQEPETYSVVASSVSVNTTTTFFDSTYVRECQECVRVDTFSNVGGVGEIAIPSATGDLWFHANLYVGSGGLAADTSNNGLIRFLSGTTSNFRLRMTDTTTGDAAAEYSTDGTTWTSLGTLQLTMNAVKSLDIHFKRGSSGACEIYQDGVLKLSVTGTYSTVSATFNKVRFGAASYNGGSAYWSEMIASDGNTVGMRLNSLAFTGAGANASWTGAYTDVNETNVNTGTALTTNATGAKQTMAVADMVSLPAGYSIAAVVVSASAALAASSVPTDVAFMMRSGGTDYNVGQMSLTAGAGAKLTQKIQTSDPATSAAWTTSGVNALEVGVTT